MERSLFKISKRLILYHLLAWCSYAVILFSINKLTNENVTLSSMVVLTFLFACVFYAMLWIFIVFYRKRRYALTCVAILLFSVLIYGAGHWYIYSLMPEMNFIVYLQEGSLVENEYMQNTLLALMRFTVYSFTYYLVGVGQARAYALLKMTKEGHQKDVELLETKNKALQYEIELLTAQVDPHYLHNKLNGLYARLIGKAPDEAQSLLQLNDILVYMMTPSIQGTGWVLIEKEIEYLHHAMNLDLSTKEKENVILSIEGEMEPHLIPYMTLLTVFDNIIKYGVIDDPANPVQMKLVLEEDSLRFSGKNKIERTTGLNNTSYGTGLASLKRRLEIGFPGRNEFSTQVVDDYFRIDLLISY